MKSRPRRADLLNRLDLTAIHIIMSLIESENRRLSRMHRDETIRCLLRERPTFTTLYRINDYVREHGQYYNELTRSSQYDRIIKHLQRLHLLYDPKDPGDANLMGNKEVLVPKPTMITLYADLKKRNGLRDPLKWPDSLPYDAEQGADWQNAEYTTF